ncbi:MAG: YidC/Oxa1 family insertase periplasmic-domain containing protein [Phycisphaerales bacterium]|nr:MAG: YidC/Oxa1 family insertase periplasmic-domain containing protein [Phycisphaerales bacterium]
MPQPKNTTLRILVPTVVALALAALAYVGIRQAMRPPANTPGESMSETTAPVPTPTDAVSTTPEPSKATSTAAAASTPTETAIPQPSKTPTTPLTDTPPTIPTASAAPAVTPTTSNPVYRALEYPGQGVPADLGDLTPDVAQGYKALVEFSAIGAGVKRIRLADYFETIERQVHLSVQNEVVVPTTGGGDPSYLTPLAALAVSIDGHTVALSGSPDHPLWSFDASKPGEFVATIVDASDAPVLKVTRQYGLAMGSYHLTLRQRVENLSGRALSVRFYQIGPTDLERDRVSYMSDQRYMNFGYLLKPVQDPAGAYVRADDFRTPHTKLLGDKIGPSGAYALELTQWPNKEAMDNGYRLSWVSMTNHYFGAAVVPTFDPTNPPVKALPWVESVNRAYLPLADNTGYSTKSGDPIAVGARLDSIAMSIAPGASADLSLGFYAGPLDRKIIKSDPLLDSVSLKDMVVYNIGGMCAFCTFPWITSGLLALLQSIHDFVTRDWALAVIGLVLVVRTLLHPVTRWSQVRMTRFGKQMQKMGPKQKELQEKYKGDRAKLQQETARLWKEEGISPTGMLGCLPMFLQTPVWIALYATLYFAVQLRHEAGFYGLFQKIIPSGTAFSRFLADLSLPDQLVSFGRAIHVPLLSSLMGEFHGINILPLLLGVVFFIQQKYLSPPTVASSPEQEMQMKMVKFMSVVMFPLFMYNAPAGLTLYFATNSTLAIIENKWIRSHIDRYEKMYPEAGKKKGGGKDAGKPSGFMQRVLAAAEERKKMMEQMQSQTQRRGGKK